jgi:organic hydroperoxide reductase OsmC/OhrA
MVTATFGLVAGNERRRLRESYDRDHNRTFDAGIIVRASAAPAYLGSESRVDPEEAFVANLSSCHTLTFLAIASK